MNATGTDAALDRALRERYPEWGEFAREAVSLLPSGVSHDNRYTGGIFLPVAEGFGALKRDIAGNEFVDYWMGHGSLLLGHGNARVVEAVREAAGKLTHAGGCHPLEHEWARLVIELVPSAERVRFTMSGTESAMLALRVARAHTGRTKILKLDGHFHGWSDFTLKANDPPFESSAGAGWSRSAMEDTERVPAEAAEIERLLAGGEFACLILEPTGASGGAIPLAEGFLREVREITRRTGTLLVFDEIITGFRVSPGGAQAKTGVMPDLTCLGKVLAGGLPGAAVAGPEEFMASLVHSGDKDLDRKRKAIHWGTFNANPLSAAAGAACLDQVKTGAPVRSADEFAMGFREEINALFAKKGLGWKAYGEDSVLHIGTAPDTESLLAARSAEGLKAKRAEDLWLKKALWLEGIDWPGGKQAWCSAVHGRSELSRTVEAFGRAIDRLRALGAEI